MRSDLFGTRSKVHGKKGFAALNDVQSTRGSLPCTERHVEGTFKLGQWVSHQRTNKDTMPAERRKRLDAIGFVWDRAKVHGKKDLRH